MIDNQQPTTNDLGKHPGLPLHPPSPISHLPLLLILVLFTVLTVYNAARLPIGEAADETDHYQYLRFVARTGHPPLTAGERLEAGFKGGLAPLYYWLTAWPVALVGEQTPPDIRRVDSRPERHIPTDGLGINHVLHTLDEQWPWRGQPLAWRLVRLLSLPMGWVTIIASYALARRLAPYRPRVAWLAAGFIAFLPRFVISSAVINDDNLVFALTALLLLVEVIILQSQRPPTAKMSALLAALFGLALVTKYFSLILIPEIVLVQFFMFNPQFSNGPSTQRLTGSLKIRSLAAFFAALMLTAGGWFAFILVHFNRVAELGLIPGLAASLGEPQITEGLVGLLSGQPVRPPAAVYSLGEWLGLLYRSFWFEYGWMQVFAPAWVYWFFSALFLLALAGLTLYRLPSPSHIPHATSHISRPILVLLLLRLGLFVVVVLGRYALSATIDTGQGRHLYPALPVIALMVALGLERWRWGDWRLGGLGFVTALYLLLAIYVLIPANIILPRYPVLPVTTRLPEELPVSYRLNLPLEDGLWLAGLDAPENGATGETLPVTLYWRANSEAKQDYLLSLCLVDPQQRPAACWRGHFAGGRYPARAWEAGDTLIDTVFIPVPACNLLAPAVYRLRLEVRPLSPVSAVPLPEAEPVLAHTFNQLQVRLTTGRSAPASGAEFWLGRQRLSGPVGLPFAATVSQISYTAGNVPSLRHADSGRPWPPLTGLDGALHLSCGDAAARQLTTYIASPSLPAGEYRPAPEAARPNLSLAYAPRFRLFAPLTPTLTFADTLAPLQIQLSPSISQSYPLVLPATSPLPVIIRWQARRWMPDPLVVSLKLLDKDYQVGAERVVTLGDRYPNVLWAPGEVVEESYTLRFRPDTPPGLYRLELSIVHQDEILPDGYKYLPLLNRSTPTGEHNLYPAVVRRLDPAHGTKPTHSWSARIGDSIQLLGYNINPDTENLPIPSPPLQLALFWYTETTIPQDYTVFTQLVGPDGQVWAQWDNPPQAGRYPTSAWRAGDMVVDRYSLAWRAGAPAGEYRLLVGMYDPQTGQRLPVVINGRLQPEGTVKLSRLWLNH